MLDDVCAQSLHLGECLPCRHNKINGVLVRRFPVTGWDQRRRAELEFHLNMLGALPMTDQLVWLETGAHSNPLYQHIVEHANEFDALIVLPYAMPLSHYAAWSALERTVLIPCLHDEAYAYLQVTRLVMESVRGVMFNSLEERDLAVKTLGMQPQRYAVWGEGVRLAPVGDPIAHNAPRDLLYVGRLEQGKNVQLLCEYIQRYFDAGGEIRLVVLGDGPLKPPLHPAFDYRGFVSEKEKATACASALERIPVELMAKLAILKE